MNLVVVESPAKAKTIAKYLGSDFFVLASYGHVRDLIPKEGAVDPDQDFAMHYQVIERNERHVQAIAQKLVHAQALYLATDPDREGEAISWHLSELLHQRHQLGDRPVYRVVFNEITKRAIQEAIAHPRTLSIALINAQQARRALDYLVGFNLSPLLWKKIRRGLSAGRVQSPALRLICERETEIERFVTKEYWTIDAIVQPPQVNSKVFNARLVVLNGEKLQQFTLDSEASAHAAQQAVLEAAQGHLHVETIETKQRRRKPAPPFITSTLQQEAARKLGFTTQRTMRIAQQLYEGVDVGQGAIGLITYMRTDSTHLAEEALTAIRHYITQRYGAEAIPDQPRIFKTKSKNAQEAHEAIRPTAIERDPDQLAAFLNKEQAAIYELIWKRTVACQMIDAVINQKAIVLTAGSHELRATGSTIGEPGFMRVYLEGRDDTSQADDNEESTLPALVVGQDVRLLDLCPEQHFTEPPPRYSEASLVKALEEFGIGRPSTYASIISTLQDRDYAILEQKRFYPTDVGRVVNRFLTSYFTAYVDYDFTARLEDTLDAVARGEQDWIPVLEQFWQPFKQLIDDTQQTVKRSDVTQELLDESCPECGGVLTKKLGRNGLFIGCTRYPECRYTRDLHDHHDHNAGTEQIEGRSCPSCGAPLHIKRGRYGKFIGCTAYPQCRHIEPLEKPETTGITCPQCQQGVLQKKRSKKRGKLFYSCSTYPNCNYALWNEPIAEACPQCHWPILTLKVTKYKGVFKVCPQKDCGYSLQLEESSPTTDLESKT
jgi:DNA topoisomerase-1